MKQKFIKFNIIPIGNLIILLFVFFFMDCMKDERELETSNLKQYFDEGNYSKAIQYSEFLMKKYPSSKSGYLTMISVAYSEMGDLEKTKMYLKKAIEADTTLGENYANLGVIYFNENQFKEALPFMLEGIEKGGYKDPCALVYAIGICYSKLGEVENAAGSFLAFLSRCDTDPKFIEQKEFAESYLEANKQFIYESKPN
ncbi:tetratricopeptide repeat protein [Leptospira sp. WS39.C2]